MKIKVLVVGAASEGGGVKGYVDLIASNTNPEKVEWHITVSDKKATEPAQQPSPMAPHFIARSYFIWSLPIRAMQLRRLLKQQRFDLLHLHTARAGLLGCLSSLGLPIAIVYTGHGWRSEAKKTDLSNPLFVVIERYICSRVNMVTVICQRDSDIGINKGLVASNKLVTINTRIDAKPFENIELALIALSKRSLGIPEKAYVIGMVGTVENRKDPLTFVRTAARLIKTIPDAYFLWVGGGELKDQTSKLAEQLGLGDRLVITGMRPKNEIPVLFHIMNVLLFTSRLEGIPLSILEAQAIHCPVVSSAYPGVEEVIEHGRTGYSFLPGDDETAARYVLKIQQDVVETRRMVDRATEQFLEKHSAPQRMAHEYESVYARALQSTRRT